MNQAPLAELTAYLDGYLRVGEIGDYGGAVNGLQVENSGQVGALVAAVDASLATIEGVVDALRTGQLTGPVLLLVHHGLFWDGEHAITGRRFRRIRTLLQHDIALYSAHIPLDVHPEVGNNAVLARMLGLEDTATFDEYKGAPLGVMGRVALSRADFVNQVQRALGTTVRLIPGGPERIARVGIITGGAGSRLPAAVAAGCDSFLTGEGAHHTYFDAMELGANLLYAGHYATETVGVKALAEHVSVRFGVPFTFHDHPTGM